MGQLVGDSLGSLVEFQTAEAIAQKYPQGVADLADGGMFNLIAGQPTDNSEMALALARSILRHGGYDVDDVLDSYTRWAESQPFDIENTISMALLQHSTNESSQANGALMRISPLAIYLSAFPGETVDELARIDVALTHPNALCMEINAVFVRVLAAAIHHEWDRETMLNAMIEYADDELGELINSWRLAPPEDYYHNMGWVKIAFGNAVFELANGESFEASMIRTVGRGGDTDTNAAVCGALLGGLYGVHGIPERWIEPVLAAKADADTPTPRPEEYWPTDAPALALQLLAIAGV